MKRRTCWLLVASITLALVMLACRLETTSPAPPPGNAAADGGMAAAPAGAAPRQDTAPPVVADVVAPGTVFMGGVCSPTMLTVSARVSDDTALSAVWLLYRYPGHTDFLQVPMTATGGGYYTVQIPAGSEGSRFYTGQPVPLEFQIQATDAAGKTVRYPATPMQVSVQPCLPQAADGGGYAAPDTGHAGAPPPPAGGNAGSSAPPTGGNTASGGGTASGGNDSGGNAPGSSGSAPGEDGGVSSGMVEAPPELQQPPAYMTFDPNEVDLGGGDGHDNGNGGNNNPPGGPTPATVQFCNTSQSPVVSLVFRYTDAQGIQREEEVILDVTQVIPTNGCLTVSDFQPGITYAYVAAAGFWDAGGRTITRYLTANTLVLQSGETREVTIGEPPAPQVLTEFGNVTSYCGVGWVGVDAYGMQLDFDAQQTTYTLWLDGQVLFSGTYQETRRSPSLLELQFDQGFSGTYKYAYGEISLTNIPVGGRTMLFVSLTKMGCTP